MKSLKYYLTSAEQALVRWGHPSMIKDEDCISDVAYAMMNADIRFNGKGSDYGYRGYCARMAILTLMKNYKPNIVKSLDFNISDDDDMYDIVDSNDMSHLRTELLDWIDNCSELVCFERNIIKLYYFENLTMDAVAKELGLKSRQVVHNALKIALKKLRKEVA